MSDPLGLSVGTTNLVAARVGNKPVTRRSMLTLAQSGGTISGFVERVGDRVPLVTPDGTSYRAEQLLMQALDAMVEVGGGPSPDVAIAVPAHWNPATIWAFRSALGNSRLLSQNSEHVRVVSDAVAALTALQANPGIAVTGVVALLDFGGSGTSITLANAAASFEPIGETVRYPDFSGDLIDQALLAHVLDDVADRADPAGTTAVESLTKLRDECRRAKERLSADTATQLVLELPGYRADIRLTRDELQELIQRPLDGVVSALDDLAERNGSGTSASGLAAVAIVGGGASIPLVAQRISEHTQLPVVTTPAPALNAAVGAALFAAFGADADAPTGANAATVLDAEAPTGAAAAATDVTAAEPVFDGPGTDAPGSATFRALAWSQEEGGEELVPYTGENPYSGDNPYLVTDSDVRPAVEYAPATGRVAYVEPRRPWHRMAVLGIGVAAVIAIITVGGVAYGLTSATESTKATEAPKPPEPKPPEPKPPEPEPPAPEPPKEPSPEPPPPEPPPPPPPETVTITNEAPPPPPPSPTWTPTTTVPTTTHTTTTTPPTTTTTSPTTTTETTTTTTTTTTSTTPSMTTSWVNVPFVPVPVPIQVPNTGPSYPPAYQQPPPYQQPVYPQSPWG